MFGYTFGYIIHELKPTILGLRLIQVLIWGGLWDSNPQLLDPQSQENPSTLIHDCLFLLELALSGSILVC
jgi:hypothetical protein